MNHRESEAQLVQEVRSIVLTKRHDSCLQRRQADTRKLRDLRARLASSSGACAATTLNAGHDAISLPPAACRL